MRLELMLICVLLPCGCGSGGAGRADPSSGPSDAAPMGDTSAAADGGSSAGNADLGGMDLADADLGPRTINGKLLDYFGLPVPGFTVQIGAATTTTDSAGAFTLMAPGGAYDAMVVGTTSAASTQPVTTDVRRFVGLTRSDPTLRITNVYVAPAANRQLKLAGTVTGLATPLPATTQGRIYNDLSFDYYSYPASASTLAFSAFNIGWAGAATTPTTLRAFFVDTVAGVPTMTGYGTTSVSITDGVNQTLATPIALTKPATKNLSFTIGVPATAVLVVYDTLVSMGAHAVGMWNGQVTVSTPLSLAQPDITGATHGINIIANFGSSPFRYNQGWIYGVAADAALGTIMAPTPSTPNPVVGAPSAVARDAVISVQPGMLPTREFIFVSANVRWGVVTTDSQTQFPDASALGVANPTAGTMLGLVIANEYNSDSVDAFCGTVSYFTQQGLGAGQPYWNANIQLPKFAFTN